MKIDELIKYYEWRLEQTKDFSDPHWEASERREHREFVERLETVISLLKELQWYREQDLIRREDVKAIFNEHIWDWQCGAEEAYDELLELPKAEPPIDECTPNCEKRFTCKHCIQGMYCNNRTGNEDGTPCCCEPEV